MKCSGSSSCPDTSLRPSTAKGLRRWPITIWLNGWRFSIPSLRFHNPLSPTTFYHRPGYGATKSAPAGIGSTNEGRSRPDAPGQHRRDYTTFLRLAAGAKEEFFGSQNQLPQRWGTGLHAGADGRGLVQRHLRFGWHLHRRFRVAAIFRHDGRGIR